MGRMIDCAMLWLGLAMLVKQSTLRMQINMSAQSIGYPIWICTLGDGICGNLQLAKNLIPEITEPSVMAAPEVARYFMNDMQN